MKKKQLSLVTKLTFIAMLICEVLITLHLETKFMVIALFIGIIVFLILKGIAMVMVESEHRMFILSGVSATVFFLFATILFLEKSIFDLMIGFSGVISWVYVMVNLVLTKSFTGKDGINV